MPTKLGGQGYSQENYDSSTGQYIKGQEPQKETKPEKSGDAVSRSSYQVDSSKVLSALAALRAAKKSQPQAAMPIPQLAKIKKPAFDMSEEECDAEIPSLISEIQKGGVFTFKDQPNMIFPDKRFLVSNLRGLVEIQTNTVLKNVSVSLSDFHGNQGIIGMNDHEKWVDGKGWMHSIMLSSYFYGANLNSKGFINGQRGESQIGFSVAKKEDGDYAAGPFLHECGHALEGELISKISPSQDTIYTQVSNMIQNEICALAEQGQSNPKMFYNKYYPSNAYGNTNSKEFFAETFSSIFCGNPNPYAIALKKILIKYGIWKGQQK